MLVHEKLIVWGYMTTLFLMAFRSACALKVLLSLRSVLRSRNKSRNVKTPGSFSKDTIVISRFIWIRVQNLKMFTLHRNDLFIIHFVFNLYASVRKRLILAINLVFDS